MTEPNASEDGGQPPAPDGPVEWRHWRLEEVLADELRKLRPDGHGGIAPAIEKLIAFLRA